MTAQKRTAAATGTAGLAGLLAYGLNLAGVQLPPEVLAAAATMLGYFVRGLFTRP